MFAAVGLGIADDRERASHKQAAQITITCLLILPSVSLPPLERCFGTSPTQAEKFGPDRKAFGSATLATRAVASAGPTPRDLIQPFARFARSVPGHDLAIKLRICAFSIRSWAPRASRQARAASGKGVSLASAVLSCASHERQPNGAPARFPVFQRLPLR